MKKVLLAILLVMLVTVALVACGNGTKAGDTTTVHTGGTDSTPAQTDLTDPEGTAPITPAETELKVTDDYTALLDQSEWVAGELDYDVVGDGKLVTKKINSTYNGYKKTYYVISEDGTKTESSGPEVQKISEMIGASVVADKTAKTVVITVEPCELVVKPSWKSVTARAGSYLMFEFTTNCNSNFYMTVTDTEGARKALPLIPRVA